MSALETPEAMAERMFGHDGHARAVADCAIRARDEQIAAECEAKAAEAAELGKNFPERGLGRARCEGKASAYRAIAATLRGAR